MSPINFNMHSSSTRSSQPRMAPKDKLFGLEVKQSRLFEYDSYRFFFNFSTILNKIFYNFEVNLFMLDQKRLNLIQILDIVNAKDLVQEFDRSRSVILQGILVYLF